MSTTPELDNWKEIEGLLESHDERQREMGVGKALQNVTLGVVNVRHSLAGLRSTIGKIGDNLVILNKNLQDADESSKKLTQALNIITLAGVIVAGIGILIALANFIWDIYKTLYI